LLSLVVALIGGGLLGCGGAGGPGGPGEAVGTAALAVMSVPADVACLRITAQGAARQVVTSIDVTAGQTVAATLSGLPTGQVAFSGDAFNVACVNVVASSVATWVSDTLVATVATSPAVQVSLVFHPSGQATLGADFQGDPACFPDGGTCTLDAECCAGQRCLSGVCSTPPPVCAALGGPCATNADCCAGNVCTGGACAVPPALFTFSGVASNVPVAELTGWTQCYSDTYANSATPVASILAACSQANLLLACRTTGSPTLTIAAHAPRADVTFDTGTLSVTHDANGVGWYFNNSFSWGFAPAGDAVLRNSCDVGNSDASLRLCWHTGGGNINAGYRCGASLGIFDGTFERIVYQAP
jgi:hypothetical protein